MKPSNRIICVTILAAMLVSTAVSCGGRNPASTSAKETEQTTAPVVTEPVEQLEVPDKTYEGYSFTYLTAGQVAYNDFDFAEDATTVLDDAQYQRKLKVEEQFDITIEQQTELNKAGTATPGFSKFRTAYTSNEALYDLANMGGYCVTKCMASNYLYDLNSTTNIKTAKSWWDQNANRDLAFNGKLFFTTGELSGARSENTFVIFYNKNLGSTKKLEAPYQLVRDGKWTLDTFSQMCLAVSEDLNGDDVKDERDRYGLYCWDDAMIGILAAAGVKCTTIDTDGVMEMSLYNEASEEAFNKFTKIVFNKDFCLSYQRYSGKMNVTANWCSDYALFWATSNINTQMMREMESDFSILPYPKLNEAQSRYYTTVAPYNSQFICMFTLQEDEGRTSAIAEALAYYGQKIVTPALYDKTVKGGQIRDEDTADMLDIIYSNYIYDIGYYFNIASLNTSILNLLRQYDTGFASMWAKNERAANAQLSQYNKAMEEILANWDK